MASTGSSTDHGWTVMREPVLVDHQPPVGGRRLQAEAEEADRRDEPDRVRHAQADLDQQRAGDVRQQLAEDDPRALLADRLGRLDEVALDDLLGGAAHHARDARRVREPDDQHDQPQLRAERRDGEQREDDLREREQHVVAAHQHVVDPVARVGRHEADDHADHDAEQRRRGRHPQHAQPAVQEAAPDVAAERVGAEQRVATTARCSGSRRTRSASAARTAARTPRPARCSRTIASADPRARHPQRALEDAEPRAASGATAAPAPCGDRALEREVDRAVDGLLAHRVAVLSFGVTRIVSTSAARLSST